MERIQTGLEVDVYVGVRKLGMHDVHNAGTSELLKED